MKTDESQTQRMVRRYGPLAGIVVVLALIALFVVTTPKSNNDGGVQAGSSGGGGDGVRPISFTQAKKNNLNVTFGPGCDQTRGKIAIPSAFAPDCFAQRTDNGGATSPGVTADSVKVVLYQGAPDPLIDQILAAIGYNDPPEAALATYQGYFEIYNRFYETYGRKVELVRFQGTGTSMDEVAARADATNIAEQLHPFAVIGGPLLTGAFGDELAARHIIQIDLASSKGTQFFNDHSPYNWNILTAPDQTSAVVAEYLGKRLKDHPAKNAGDPELAKQNRKFGLYFLSLPGGDTDVLRDKFVGQLKEQGIELAVIAGNVDPTASAAQQVAKLKEAGVTSVLFSGDPLSPKNLTEEATRQDYHPEWIITGSALTDSTTFARTYDQDQWAHAFGVSQLFARGKPSANWSYFLYNWYFGSPPPATNGAQVIFPSPTIIFSGIMAAGPRLTPESFRDGLFSADPIGGGLTVPQVSFGKHGFFPETDFNGIDDTVEIWYDPKATGPDERGSEGVGMYRYVDGGKRYLPGQWPTGEPKVFVDDPTSVALYQDIPAADKPPDYPPPKR